ncbi:prolyl oligopeptidase family serine peptidase [Pseudobacteroides cellulosolvens]|uniref:Peptidase n=1 Tax=Pseudobacteroides cellulosolvens ATCC 35603 = DSM 2933 TaxID=398512 RepID=A0A0L6JUF0_9FIRM|nr:prolyl oligopeptidase family serine peptidase [Pseudobacteroides cellulosolvens]KNY29448.1 hypothetical protein Bccel_4722 [Pseudobacteroides cellulosolvens ATCC 35603 = DSM 2933]
MSKRIKNPVRIVMLLILTAAVTLSFNMNAAARQTPVRQTNYRTVTEIFDWGAASTKVIIDLGKPVVQGSVSKDTFTVFVSRSDARIATPLLEEGYRTITKAYVSDRNGTPALVGKYAVLEMEIGPNVSLSSPINYYEGFNSWIDYNYKITQVKDIGFGPCKIKGLVVSKHAGETRKLVDDFSIGKSSYDDITFTYADYKPSKDHKKNPLIIWLHGWGEGGTDATLPLSANKSVNLSSKEIQSYFGGAYVLVPQANTYWMDGFTGIADGTSKYEKALMAFIKDYVSKNKDIDPNRVYIGGCSSGGYMTMLMIRDYPEYFAAAFPVCEGLIDVLITDEQILKMKDVPIWFTAAKTDPTLPPAEFTTPTYERLIDVGAKNVCYTLFEDVHDTSGLYKNADGTAFEYDGHFSWIYVYNNECETTINGKTTTIMEWLASMTLDNR